MNKSIFLTVWRESRVPKSREMGRCCNVLKYKKSPESQKSLTKVSTYAGLYESLHGTNSHLEVAEVSL